MVTELDLVGSPIEVATSVAVEAVGTVAGAVYVADVVDCADSAPAPVKVQVTPLFSESFVTVAVTVTVWPPLSGCAAEGERETATGEGDEVQPASIIPNTNIVSSDNRFMGGGLHLCQN